TFRTVANVWAGYGLRWNVIERVQTFTHPLWLFLLALVYGITREVYWSSLLLSLVCTAATVWLITRHVARTATAAAIPLALMIASRSFMAYSSSGLENPLTHLLVVAFWIVLGVQSVFAQTLMFSLCALNRLDVVPLLIPLLAVSLWRTRAPRTWIHAFL